MPDTDRVDNREEEEEKGWIARLGKAVTALKPVGRAARKALASTPALTLAAGLIIGGLLLTLAPGVSAVAVGLLLGGGAALGTVAFGSRLSEGKRAREHQQAQKQEQGQEVQSEILKAFVEVMAARADHGQTRPPQENRQFQSDQSLASARTNNWVPDAIPENTQMARAAQNYSPGGAPSDQRQGSLSSVSSHWPFPPTRNFSTPTPTHKRGAR